MYGCKKVQPKSTKPNGCTKLTSKAKYHVPSGTFHVSQHQPLILQAFLGTCVGLALQCESTGVGGIIHLLLPEPITPLAGAQPEKYAASGLPLFIEALTNAGAQRASLAATIAGGALVGPLSRQDLDLDIGGRTVEVAKKILTEEKIKIVQSETGGFFTCCLNLDMSNGKVDIEPVGQSKLSDDSKVHTATIDEITSAMNALKPIPQVALKILRLLDENRYDIESIANEIRKDQVITGRMLQLANSAMFAVKKEITSLDHAVVFLGQDMLVKLVLSAAVQAYYEQSKMGYALCKGGIYHHSIGCAQASETLARKTGREDPAKAYTAGLLHDIGKVVLDQYVASAYPLFYRDIMEEEDNVLNIERNLLGMDHTEVGSILAQQWSLPKVLEEVIRHHHHPHQAAENSDLSTIVYLADLLMSRFHTGLEIERMDTGSLGRNLDALGLSNQEFGELVDAIPLTVFLTSD
jgi:putative nucleotidyltransferase with HDIG domain